MTNGLSVPEDELAMEETTGENVRLLNFLYACPIGLVEISSDGTIDMMNPVAMQLLLRMSPEPPVNLFEVTTAHAPELRNLLVSFTPDRGTVCDNHRILVRALHVGRSDLEVLSCTLVKLGPERYIVSLSDISNLVRQERKLKEAESWFASLLEGASDFGVASLDGKGRIASISASMSKQFGFREEDLIGQSLKCLQAPAGHKGSLTVEEELAAAAREGWHLNEDWHRHQDGSIGWYQRLVAVRNDSAETEDITGYTVVLRESQRRSLDVRRLKEMLTRDHLTGTFNRMHFFDLAERECVRKKRYLQPLSMLIADIDFFKQVNDTNGHAMGDEVLKQFAKVCLSSLRPSDSMARIGGEEFAILLPGTGLDGAKLLAERLRVAVSEARVILDGKSIAVTASFGCADASELCDLPTIMADADAALYEAKHAGRNCVVARHASR